MKFITKTLIFFFLNFITVDVLVESCDNIKCDNLPSKEMCGYKKCDAFPWVVFIPLQTRVPPDVDIRCVGVLISNKYVITLKSCLQFVLTKVHLGQYDVTTNTGCTNKSILEVNVEGKVINESLPIILLRLADVVGFSKAITPICLPSEEYKSLEPGDKAYASGWGLLGPSSVEYAKTMKVVKSTVLDNEECKELQNVEVVDNLSLCIRQGDTDKLCNGDEGGPIMYKSNGQWVLGGILQLLFDSSSLEPCKREEPIPGYRITNEVLEWIKRNIRE